MYKLISVTKNNQKVEKGYCLFQEWYEAIEFINSVEQKLTGKVLSPRSAERTFLTSNGGIQSYRLIKIEGIV